MRGLTCTTLGHWLAAGIILLLRGYQRLLSPWIPPACRFHPTCSHYAVLAFQRHGCLAATGLTLRRLARCHPFHPGGLDPVP